jgi:pyruvate/2-oxoglutarate dehydrogenase complex dihydrolipoamide acyltransferase (E2) component
MPQPIGEDQLQELGRLFTAAKPDPEERRSAVMAVLKRFGKAGIKDLTQAEFASLRAKLTEAIAKQQPQQQPAATATEPAPQQKQEAAPTQAEVDAAKAKADASMAATEEKGRQLEAQSAESEPAAPEPSATVSSTDLVTLPQLTKLRELMNELVPADRQRDWIKNVLTCVNKPTVKELSQGEWSALTTRMEVEIAKRKLAANPT